MMYIYTFNTRERKIGQFLYKTLGPLGDSDAGSLSAAVVNALGFYL